MGEVYRARDSRLERAVALKLLPAAVRGDPDRLLRFEREAKLLAALNHPNIAHVYGFEQAASPSGQAAHVLAMELVEGEDLARCSSAARSRSARRSRSPARSRRRSTPRTKGASSTAI